jgi:hypothetical protein
VQGSLKTEIGDFKFVTGLVNMILGFSSEKSPDVEKDSPENKITIKE